MGQDLLTPDGWSALLGRPPADLDLAAGARQHAALRRARGVPSAAAPLRLALVCADTPLSLRGTAAWAAASGVADLSDVALLGRLRNAEGWLEAVPGAPLAARAGPPTGVRRAVELVDATSLAAPGGGPGAAWRVHARFDPARGGFAQLRLTSGAEAESLARFDPAPGTVLVADRFHAKGKGLLAAAAERGAAAVVRHGVTGCALLDGDGRRIGLKDVLAREAGPPDVADLPVRVPRPGGGSPPLAARLVLLGPPPEAAAKARARAREKARRQGPAAGPGRLAGAGWLALLTTPGGEVPAGGVLALYRPRWQVELAFERLKSQLRLGDLRADDPGLARATPLAELVLAALADQVLAEAPALSPSRPGPAALAPAPRPPGPGRPAPGAARRAAPRGPARPPRPPPAPAA